MQDRIDLTRINPLAHKPYKNTFAVCDITTQIPCERWRYARMYHSKRFKQHRRVSVFMPAGHRHCESDKLPGQSQCEVKVMWPATNTNIMQPMELVMQRVRRSGMEAIRLERATLSNSTSWGHPPINTYANIVYKIGSHPLFLLTTVIYKHLPHDATIDLLTRQQTTQSTNDCR